jgi:hypothetical protein
MSAWCPLQETANRWLEHMRDQNSSRSSECRQRPAQAKKSAAEASNPSIKSAFEEVASGWFLASDSAREKPSLTE